MTDSLVTRQVVMPVDGFGTRLGSLTSKNPKCVLPVAGRPFLAFVIESLATQGAEEFILCAGQLVDAVSVALGDGSAFGVQIRYSVEPYPLGVIGALLHAHHLLAESFVLSSGDVYHRVALSVLAARADESPVDAVMTVSDSDDGNVDLSADSRVVRYEKNGTSGPHRWIDAGLLVMRRALLGSESNEADLFGRLVAERRLAALVLQGQLDPAAREGPGDADDGSISSTASLQVVGGSVPVVLAVERARHPYDIGQPAGWAEFAAAVDDGRVGASC